MKDRKNTPNPPADIEVHLAHDSVEIDPEQVRQLARFVLTEEQHGDEGLSVAFVDDPTIASINEQYLKHEGPTDVISFPLRDADDRDRVLGEIVVSLDTAIRQGPEHGRDPHSEALLYVVHGILHLLGYDDHDADDRQNMERRQEQLLAAFLAK